MMNLDAARWLLDLGTGGTLLALLLAGHALGDFVFQTDEMVRRKREPRWLLYHVLEVTSAQAVLLLPFFSLEILAGLVIIALSHGLIDRGKTWLTSRSSRPLRDFCLDQLAHLIVLGLVWWMLTRLDTAPLPILAPHLPLITTVGVVIAAYAFNYNGGAAVVGLLLANHELPKQRDVKGERGAKGEDPAATLRLGRLIGILERMLVLSLVLVDEWGALGLILVAKSVARFKDLDQRAFSQYYLTGTLTSVLVAVASGLAVRLLI